MPSVGRRTRVLTILLPIRPFLPPLQDLAEDLLSDFRNEWQPIAEALDASDQFFDDLGDLVKEEFAHDIDTLSTTNSVWRVSKPLP